jgi:hypothetical protein
MTDIREFSVIQNVALGGLAVWAFTTEFYSGTNSTHGPVLPLLMPVLPIVFHQESVAALNGRQLRGGLYRALSEVRVLPAGLQDRMEAMAPQTFKAIRTAYAAGLVSYDRETAEVLPLRQTAPQEFRRGEPKLILQTARRLGFWFATTPLAQLGLLLNLRF